MSKEHQKRPEDKRQTESRAGRNVGELSSKVNEFIGRKYFLGIAIDEYVHWPRLRNAKRDVFLTSAVF